MIAQTRATSATKPIVRPTAPPVLSPPLLCLEDIEAVLGEFGGAVGVTVTVTGDPEIVESCVIGVGVHVIEDDDEEVVWESDIEGVVDGAARVGVMISDRV